MTTVHGEGALLSGRYRLGPVLGHGGMSTVRRARDESLGRDVAIKVFSHGLADAETLARHRDEVQLLASMSHPGLVTLFDAATEEETDAAYLVMELVEGDDLRRRLDDGPLPPAEVAVIGRQVAEALAYTHSRGVIHRDVKPGNILLPRREAEPTGVPAKLADFGIARIIDGARLTATGTVIGTAGYFSPEQALGQPLTGSSDIYALGLVLLEALTGERAFPGSAEESMAARIARDPHIPSELGADWVALLTQMTAREAERRPDGLEVAEHLSQLVGKPSAVLTEEHTEPLDPTRRYPPAEAPSDAADSASTASAGPDGGSDRRRRRPALITALTAALVIALLVVIVTAVRLQAGNEAPAIPDYPAVEGPLAESIQQLQRSVEP
ncbi:serine/threonine protein kinase [Salinibacterium sp. SYSU T00001]|uniref:serine/threonine-protein kinase n=1 Tax=Homoserinimonas sedimenticola TaxID=2986805 RepID=UPI002235D4BF|nr:serine/threonine-protein kinase [Salinibacterium sedimenticola]MCW4386698.1 serine/threonine protein kinase [Salinibacterium sedimenticola]